jgi:hypothetical protein
VGRSSNCDRHFASIGALALDVLAEPVYSQEAARKPSCAPLEPVTHLAKAALAEGEKLGLRHSEHQGRTTVRAAKAALLASYCHRRSHFVVHASARRRSAPSRGEKAKLRALVEGTRPATRTQQPGPL